MKRYAVPLLIAVLIILQLVSLSRIESLQSDLKNINSKIVTFEAEQKGQLNSIYTNINTMLNKQASIIDSYKYTFGVLNADTLTVPVTFNISPKETKEDTAATLYISDESAVMNRKGTSFTSTIPVNIFDVLEVKVVIEAGGVKKTEKLEILENLQKRVLPTIYARFEGESGTILSAINKDQSREYHKKGKLSIDVKPAQNGNTIENTRMVIDLDGKAVTEKTLDCTNGFWADIDEKLTVSAGQTLTFSVIATDSIGLIYKTTVDKLEFDSNANPVKRNEWNIMDNVTITDKNGNILNKQ